MTIVGVVFSAVSEVVYIVKNGYDSRWNSAGQSTPAKFDNTTTSSNESICKETAAVGVDIEAQIHDTHMAPSSTTSALLSSSSTSIVYESATLQNRTTASSWWPPLLTNVKRAVSSSLFLLAASLIFALGYLTWHSDNDRWICYPDFPIQGHSIWHLMSGVSILLIFIHAHF